MTSRLTIFNQALALVEQEPMRTPDDQTVVGNECRLWYASVRDALLRAYPWSFAAARAQLAANANRPAFGRSNAFPWPSDCLAVRRCPTLNEQAWEVEGFAILADAEAPLNIHYTKRVDQEGLYDPLFSEAFAHVLAKRIAPRIARASVSRVEALGQDFRELITQAWAVDAIMGPADIFEAQRYDPFAGIL